MAVPSVPTRVFHAPSQVYLSRLAMVLAAMSVAPVVMIASGERVYPEVLGAFGVLMLVMVMLFLYLMRAARITVTPEGVQLHGIGFRVFARWDNMQAIGGSPILYEGIVEGLILRESGLEVSEWMSLASLISPLSRVALDQYNTFLPLEPILTKHWRESGLGELLRRYAPHLFVTE